MIFFISVRIRAVRIQRPDFGRRPRLRLQAVGSVPVSVLNAAKPTLTGQEMRGFEGAQKARSPCPPRAAGFVIHVPDRARPPKPP
jgi:hypothetical protein